MNKPNIDTKAIEELYDLACSLLVQDKYNEGIEIIEEALALIPEPKTAYDESLLLYIIMADIYYYQDETLKSLELFYMASNCPNGVEHPFINLRLGQLYFELEHIERCIEYLMLSYMVAGRDIFENEHPVFLEIVDDVLKDQEFSELDEQLSNTIDEIVLDSSHQWIQGNHDKALNLLEKAWALLPDNKFDYVESYIISSGFVENAIAINDHELLKIWQTNLLKSAQDVDFDGEREFIAAKAAYELNEKEKALNFFDLAFAMNSEIAFEPDEKKYEQFYLKNSVNRSILS